MSKTKKIIIGAVTGAVVGTIMEIFGSYLDGVSASTKAVLAGIMAVIIYILIIAIVKLVRPVGAAKE